MQHYEWRSYSRESEAEVGSATLPPAYASHGSRENEPTMDGARGALLSLAASSRLRATQARCAGSVMSWRDRCKYQQKESDGASLQDEVACPDGPMTNKPAKKALAEAD